MDDIHFNTTLGNISVSFRSKPKELKKREFEKDEIHRILNLLNIPSESLSYGPLGNPILSLEGKFVSFSHSEGWFAVYLGNSKLGVDIQVFHKRIIDGKSYFTNERDSHWTDELNLHLIWAAKEAIFKKHEGKMTDCRVEVSILQIDLENQTISGMYNEQSENLKFEKLENAVLVYTLD